MSDEPREYEVIVRAFTMRGERVGRLLRIEAWGTTPRKAIIGAFDEFMDDRGVARPAPNNTPSFIEDGAGLGATIAISSNRILTARATKTPE